MKNTYLDYKETVNSYVNVLDWRVKENSTVTYSVGGLIPRNSGAITANYWLSEIYDEGDRQCPPQLRPAPARPEHAHRLLCRLEPQAADPAGPRYSWQDQFLSGKSPWALCAIRW